MISIETLDDCTIFRVTGEVTANEIIMQAVQYRSGEQTETSMWDFSQVTRVKISTIELHGMADSLKKIVTNNKTRKVALVGSKNINIGLGKIFVAFAQMAGLPCDYKVFRTISLAEDWLADKLR